MLREFKQVKQEAADGSRRWFESDGFDLVVWLDHGGDVAGFQICYDFGGGEHALTWRKGKGCVHNAVDSGSRLFQKLTPILVADGKVPWAELRSAFDERSRTLEPKLRDLVRSALADKR